MENDAQQFVPVIPLELLHISGIEDLPVVNDDDLIADRFNFFHVVRYVDDGFSLLLQLLNRFKNIIAGLRVNAYRRLVHDDELRIVHNAACNIKASLHTAGKFGGLVLGSV
ncbi:hypothetical protein D3C74_252580 [compost metagenome]